MNWLKIILFAFCVSGLFFTSIAPLNVFCLICLVALLINFIAWIFKSIFKGGRTLDNYLRKSDFTLFPRLRDKRLAKQKEEFEKKKNEISWKVWNDN